MPTVETVRGPVDVAELGTTLMHEHVFVFQPEMAISYNGAWGAPYWDEEVRVADAVAKLTRARDGGIRTIVDPTVPGLGRDVARIKRIVEQVPDFHVVVAAGFYGFLEMPSFLVNRTDDQIVELYVREFRDGIAETGVKPAFLKCSVDREGIIGDIPRVLATIAATSLETGAPIMVHTNAEAQTGLPVLAALTGHGVDPRKVVIAHAGDSNDLAYLRAIADQGAWLGCDRFQIEHFNPDADRVRTLAALIAEGYVEQVHLGHDAACFYDFMHENPAFAEERPDYLHIRDKILPQLLEAGVTQAHIDTMLIDNPRRFFS
jgi:phosphotriesterase-related protein